MATLEFSGLHAEFLADTTREIDIEGSLNCGKTTVCLWKVLEVAQRHPGIWCLIARYSDDATKTKLIPAFTELCALRGDTPDWNGKENFFEFENSSRVYAFGLKAVSLVERYSKIRGFAGSIIYVDQAEELPSDLASELRARLRPDVRARIRGSQYPKQLIFSPNPMNDDSWLTKQFPSDNHLKGRRYYALSLYDNAHNLEPADIAGLEAAYPPEHPKHLTVILGQRGLNVIGDPIYEGLFDRALHVRPAVFTPSLQLLEAFEVGKHNPAWLLAQRTFAGGLRFLGGLIGKDLIIEDFLPIVRRYLDEWCPGMTPVNLRSCTGPMGDARVVGSRDRFTLLNLLRGAGVHLAWRDEANSPDVQLAMIEYIGGLLRRRTSAHEESILINDDPSHWLVITRDGVKEKPFLAYAFEGGYTWSEHFVSVSNKELRQPTEDDEYANAMHCVENLALNFCAGQLSDADRERRRIQSRRNLGGMPSARLSGPGGWLGQPQNPRN